jgi:hypothetical protein
MIATLPKRMPNKERGIPRTGRKARNRAMVPRTRLVIPRPIRGRYSSSTLRMTFSLLNARA